MLTKLEPKQFLFAYIETILHNLRSLTPSLKRFLFSWGLVRLYLKIFFNFEGFLENNNRLDTIN